MRLPMESINLFQGDAIPQNSVRTYRQEFPLGGEGFHGLRLVIHNNYTDSTGTGPILRGGFQIIHNILLRTSKNEEIISIPGKGLYYLNWILQKAQPVHDEMALATAVYDAVIDIPFSHDLIARLEDLALDSGRYSMIEMQVTLGGVADLLSAVTGDTNTTTVDLSLVRNKGCMEKTGKPLALPFVKSLPPRRLTQGFVELESAEDLTLYGFILVCHSMDATNGHVPCPGVPFTGCPQDWLDDITFRDNITRYCDNLQLDWFRQERRKYADTDHPDVVLAAAPGTTPDDTLRGVYPYLFIQEKSVFNGYWTGQKSLIRIEWNPVGLGGVIDPQIDTIIFGMRKMRA